MRISRPEAKQRNRAALLAAARTLITQRGSRVSLDAIAERAGLTTGAVYSIFGSKQALVVALSAELRNELLDRMQQVAAADLPLEQLLGDLADNWLPGGHTKVTAQVRLELQMTLWAMDDRKIMSPLTSSTDGIGTALVAALTDRRFSADARGPRTTKAQAEILATHFRALVGHFAIRRAAGLDKDGSACRRACESLIHLVRPTDLTSGPDR